MSPRTCVAAALLLTGCFGGGSVTRIVDGRVEEGRPIAEEAYAADFRAGIDAASGDRERALEELDRALAADPDSPELYARYGRIACRPVRGSPPRPGAALAAFSRAINLDATYAPAWLGRAECLVLLGRKREALTAARIAAEQDPLDPKTTAVVARLLFAFGQRERAWAWLDGLATLRPDSREAQLLLLAAALSEHDSTREHLARKALAAAGEDLPGRAERELTAGIAARDLAAVRRAAVDLRLSSSALALRLAKVAPELALEQASTVLAADPTASDAWVAALAASDELGDRPRFEALLGTLAREPQALSPGGVALLRELVERHSGPDATASLTRALKGAP